MSNTYCSKKTHQRPRHRAVAPIIATLLMVAIAVVGGILIYTFTQGFFSESQVSAPQIDVISIYGYDASDTVALITHSGTSVTMNTSGEANGKLATGEAIVLYVRNNGGSIVTISDVKMFGESYTIESSDGNCDTSTPGNGEFSMAKHDSTFACTLTSLQPGQEMSLFLAYTGGTGDVKIGRSLPVTIVTGGGMEFTKQVQNGVQLG